MSQADQILRLLETGPKTCAELLREVPCIVHSRISDLRARGHLIEHTTTGPGAAGSLYTLAGSLCEPDREWTTRTATDGALATSSRVPTGSQSEAPLRERPHSLSDAVGNPGPVPAVSAVARGEGSQHREEDSPGIAAGQPCPFASLSDPVQLSLEAA